MTITLTKEYLERHKARAIPGAFYDREARAWLLKDPTPRGAAVALRMFPILSVTNPELTELRSRLGQQVRPFNFADDYGTPIDAVRVRESLSVDGHDLYAFQAIDAGYVAAVLDAHGGAYIGHERGLGKTISTCALIDELDCQRTLIVCPNTAKLSVWAPELAKYCPWLEVVTLRNGKAQREKDLACVQQLRKSGLPFALIVHYEALVIISGKSGVSLKSAGTGWDKYGEWDLVVADEAHRLANKKTLTSRAIKKIPTKRKLALSGSIIQNHLSELYSPLNWLFPDRYRSHLRDWDDRFLDFVNNGFANICIGVKIEMLDELRDELGRFLVYRTKDDELDLPGKTIEERLVDLAPAQRKAYDELVENYFTSLPDGTIIKATDQLALLTRLRQVATGLDLFGDEIVDSSKQDFAMDLIMDNPDEAFVVFSWFKAAGRALQARLESKGVGTFLVDGDVPQSKRAPMIDAFQAGEGRVFMGTIKTLGESVTLHRARNVIFLDQSWNPGDNSQSEDRVYRIGQDRPVTITKIVARDTVDEMRVLPVIQNKEELRRLILGG